VSLPIPKTLLLSAAVLFALTQIASAQVPIRVRGAITKVSGQTLTVISRDSSTVEVRLADSYTVTGVVTAALQDIKPGVFVGTAALPQGDGTDMPIVTFTTGEKAMLQPGAHVFIPVQQQSDGTVTASRVLVGKDGLVPPM
jgi:hypothetical protein